MEQERFLKREEEENRNMDISFGANEFSKGGTFGHSKEIMSNHII